MTEKIKRPCWVVENKRTGKICGKESLEKRRECRECYNFRYVVSAVKPPTRVFIELYQVPHIGEAHVR